MMRWLKIARAEAIRDVSMALRYPLEFVSGVVIMYVFFLGIVTGGRALAGTPLGGESLEQMVIAFLMWFLALMALNAMSVDLESEARQGTLEQIYINAPSFLGLMWVRGIVHVLLGAIGVIALAFLIQVTTGQWLSLNAGTAGLALLAVLLNIVELLGFGLILGGLTLVFKRLGQVSAIVQFGLFFIALADLSHMQQPWATVAQHVPLAAGVRVVTLLNAGDVDGALVALVPLIVDTVLFAVLGSVVFLWFQRQALKQGSLSHY